MKENVNISLIIKENVYGNIQYVAITNMFHDFLLSPQNSWGKHERTNTKLDGNWQGIQRK